VPTLLYNDSGKPHRHVLAQGTTTVGRAPGNDLILWGGRCNRAVLLASDLSASV
jgi:hypothetical protein